MVFDWLRQEITELPGNDYLVLFGVMSAILLYLLYFAYGAYRRFRFMDGTATSKIRSAAQGHVELKGLGEWLPEDKILSPFSQSRCVWYHCTIDKRKRSGKRTTWTNISDDRSSHLFRLVDDTGDCIIDPDYAHVIAETDRTWYGRSTADSARPPTTRGWLSLSGGSYGSYRFRERLIRTATPMYALGWFHTVRSNPSDEFIDKQVDDLIRQWKLQPQRYLRDYDIDGNGKIQRQEWKLIRTAARREVLARINDEHREHHVMSRPRDSGQPFILSAIEEESLVARKKMKAYSSIAAAFLIFTALVTMYSIRPPLPLV